MSFLRRLRAAPLTLLVVLFPQPGYSSSAIVPDAYPTVQQAIDSWTDSVLVRSGTYPERIAVYRALTLLALDPNARPRISGMDFYNYFFDPPDLAVAISDCAFSEDVRLYTTDPYNRALTLSFDRCVIDSGIVHAAVTDPGDFHLIALHDCRLSGASFAYTRTLSMVADTVDGSVFWRSEGLVNVHDCWFRGGTGTAVAINGRAGAVLGELARNKIDPSYEIGLYCEGLENFSIRNNTITAPSRFGVQVATGGVVTVADNVITECDIGVYAWCDYQYLVGNAILRTRIMGILAEAAYVLEVKRNTVGWSGGAGVVVQMAPYSGDVFISNNTSVRNQLAGFDIRRYDPPRQTGTVTIRNNVGCLNGTWGLAITPDEIVDIGCNDWFGNVAGPVSGTSLGVTDLLDDPRFCDVDQEWLELLPASPLVDAPGCGLIGAQGICGTTGVLLESVSLEIRGGLVRARWRFAAGVRVEAAWLERAADQAGPWVRVGGEPRQDGDEQWVDDDGVSSLQGHYWYRVGWQDRGVTSHSEAVHIVLTERRHVATIEHVLPNPSLGTGVVEWTLPSACDVEMSLFDPAGRRVAVLERGRFEAGLHKTVWPGRGEATASLPSGMYFVRLQTQSGSAVCRILLSR